MITYEHLLPFLNRIMYSFKDGTELWNHFSVDAYKMNISVNAIAIHNHLYLYEFMYTFMNCNKLATKYCLSCCTHVILAELYGYIHSLLFKDRYIPGELQDNTQNKMEIHIHTNDNFLHFQIKKKLSGYHIDDYKKCIDYICLLNFDIPKIINYANNDKIEISINRCSYN